MDKQDELNIIDTATLLNQENREIMNKLTQAKNVDDIKEFTNLFCINQYKTKAGQIDINNQLIKLIQAQALQRFKNNPNALSNKDLLDYLNVLSNMNDKLSHSIEDINNQPLIQINNQTNELNIHSSLPGLETKEDKDKLINAVDQLLKLFQADDNRDNNIIINTEDETNGEIINE